MVSLTPTVSTTLLDATEKERMAAAFPCWSIAINIFNVDIAAGVEIVCINIVSNHNRNWIIVLHLPLRYSPNCVK